MARETAAQRKVREEKNKDEKEKAKGEIKVVTRTVIEFPGSRYDDVSDYGTYEATFDDATDTVKITAPCEDERFFKRSALIKLVEALG